MVSCANNRQAIISSNRALWLILHLMLSPINKVVIYFLQPFEVNKKKHVVISWNRLLLSAHMGESLYNRYINSAQKNVAM